MHAIRINPVTLAHELMLGDTMRASFVDGDLAAALCALLNAGLRV